MVAGIPETYIFNTEAAKLYHVHSEVDFIAESEAETDGHLGDVIDRYTRTDHYGTLEIDQDGKVFGGEWVGDSKRNHPDFLASNGPRSCDHRGRNNELGFIKAYSTNRLQTEPETGMVTFREAARHRGEWKHFGPYHATQGDFSVRMTGTGDADVYVRREMAPTASEYDCRPYVNGSEESCTLQGAGAYYVSVFGYANSEFEFRATFDTTPVETVTDTEETDTEETVTEETVRKRPSQLRPSRRDRHGRDRHGRASSQPTFERNRPCSRRRH